MQYARPLISSQAALQDLEAPKTRLRAGGDQRLLARYARRETATDVWSTQAAPAYRGGLTPPEGPYLDRAEAGESMIEICRDHAANVKRSRWQDSQMVLRWVAAGMGEARKQFRRVDGHLHLPALWAALDQTLAATVTPAGYNKQDAA